MNAPHENVSTRIRYAPQGQLFWNMNILHFKPGQFRDEQISDMHFDAVYSMGMEN